MSLVFAFCLLVAGCDVPQARSSSSSSSPSGGDVAEVTDVAATERVISGTLRNVASSYDGSFSIRFSIYDSAGNKLGSASDSINALKPGETWRFKANVFDLDTAKFQYEGVWTKYGQVMASYATRRESQVATESQHEKRRTEREAEERRANEERMARDAEQSEKLRAAERAKREATLVRVIKFQHEQAEKGFGSFQYELARRYLKGDGVETNQPIAIQWLESACTNGLTEASNLLAKIKAVK